MGGEGRRERGGEIEGGGRKEKEAENKEAGQKHPFVWQEKRRVSRC